MVCRSMLFLSLFGVRMYLQWFVINCCRMVLKTHFLDFSRQCRCNQSKKPINRHNLYSAPCKIWTAVLNSVKYCITGRRNVDKFTTTYLVLKSAGFRLSYSQNQKVHDFWDVAYVPECRITLNQTVVWLRVRHSNRIKTPLNPTQLGWLQQWT